MEWNYPTLERQLEIGAEHIWPARWDVDTTKCIFIVYPIHDLQLLRHIHIFVRINECHKTDPFSHFMDEHKHMQFVIHNQIIVIISVYAIVRLFEQSFDAFLIHSVFFDKLHVVGTIPTPIRLKVNIHKRRRRTLGDGYGSLGEFVMAITCFEIELLR